MTEFAIITEKSDAKANFAKALGGNSGTFKGHTYKLIATQGHLLQWDEPELMVDPSLKDKYKDWSLESALWNINDFHWHKIPIKKYNTRNKKIMSRKDDITRIKNDVSSANKLVIATDVDPSGEGEMIGWELINSIGWKKPVYRMYHADETVNSIHSAFDNMKIITDQAKDGDYLKADVRSKWDFMSMQLTRIATSTARNNGLSIVANQGRLKSVIIRKIYNQEQLIKNYVRKPYYEVRFKDSNNHVFKIEDQDKRNCFAKKTAALESARNFNKSEITNIHQIQKHSAPPKLLSLLDLSAILAPQGFGPNEVLNTYQKLYEDHIVSYPRTDDKFITEDQFNQMLPKIDQIADLVGVNSNLLTHREPRLKTHIRTGGAHGANRPGLHVPQSLNDLKKYGVSAITIYTTLSRSFLAMFGEDYVFNQISANLKDYPDYSTQFSVPVALNYKNIFNADEESNNDEQSNQELGLTAVPFVFEGANKKPQRPTIKWIKSYLEKYDVGTGATRASTIGELEKRQLHESKGNLSTTDQGEVIAILAKDTWIADAKITETLFESMEKISTFKITPKPVLDSITELVSHDKQIIINNGNQLKSLNINIPANQTITKKDKVELKLNGKSIQISSEWGGHKFSSEELTQLSFGKTISFKTKKGFKVRGKLAKQMYKGHQFYGFLKEK